MKNLLTYIVRHLVDNPDEVFVEEVVQEDGTVTLKLAVNEADMGKVIGKDGRVIKAIRSIVRIAAIRAQKRVYIVLNDQEEKEQREDGAE